MKAVKDWSGKHWARMKPQLILPLVILGIFWACYAADFFLPEKWELKNLGVRPWSRQDPMNIGGLLGIPFAPFLHANLRHLLDNTVSWILVSWIIVLSGRLLFLKVFAISLLTSGIGCWLFGEAQTKHIGSDGSFVVVDTIHVGASGVIFGFIGFLLARGWCARKLHYTLIAFFVAAQNLGNIFGLLVPGGNPALSWSMHLWGFLGGIGFAWWVYGNKPPADKGDAGTASLDSPASRTTRAVAALITPPRKS